MPTKSNSTNKLVSPSWVAAGILMGFVIGYLPTGSWVSGIILAVGLGAAMGIGGKR